MRVPNPLAPIGALASRFGVPGRRHRQVWVGPERAHIEVKGVERPELEDLSRHVEKALEELESVHWARVNAVVGDVVVAFDPDATDVDQLVDVVEAVEELHGMQGEPLSRDRAEHPGDVGPLRRNAVALGADVVGLGVSLFGRVVVWTPPVPVELSSVVALLEHQPRVRHFLEARFGPAATDFGLGIANAMAQAVTGGPLGLAVSLGHRASVAAELEGHRAAWERREPELAGRQGSTSVAAVTTENRPTPFPAGPVERFADGIALGSIGASGLGLALTRSPRRAANVLAAGIPRASNMGREVFAAQVGRALAGHDVLVMDRRALRRLDRLDTIVFDASAITTGRMTLTGLEVFGDVDVEGIRSRVVELLGARVPREHVHDGWWLTPLDVPEPDVPEPDAPEPDAPEPDRTGPGGQNRSVFGVVHDGAVVGLATTVPELDPLTAVVTATARDAGLLVVVADLQGALAQHVEADRVVATGSDLAPAVRALQEEGRAVLLVADGSVPEAMQAADCAVGVGDRAAPAWGAHLLAARGLEDAWRVIGATAAARRVSARSARLAALGSGVGGLWALLGPTSGAGRRAALPVQAAAVVAEIDAVASAMSLERRRAPSAPEAPPWHTMEPEEVLDALRSSPAGLSDSEAVRRRPPAPEVRSRPARLVRAVAGEMVNPLTPILGIGAGMAAAVGSVSDAALVGGAMVVNAMISGAQRVRTELSIEQLYKLSETLVTARRGAVPVEVRATDLVRGDLVDLVAGDVVPADCRILEASGCEVDESVLTGESLPVTKHAAPTPGAPLAERSCMLYEGTSIVAGSALGVVVAAGEDTEARRVLVGAPEPPPSGVEARLATLTKVTVPVTLAGGAAITGLSLLRGTSSRDAVGTGVSLMVSAVPEGLPLLATVAQLSAAQRLSARNALVRNPRAIEALGRVDILCFDKTGTLTAGRIAVQRVSDGRRDERLDGLAPQHRAVLAAALRASPAPEGDDDTLPHATDQAVVEAARRAGVPLEEGLGDWRRLGELAFEPSRGFHAVVGTGPAGGIVTVKGAPESILPRCERWRLPEREIELTPRLRAELDDEVERLAAKGLRVLAVAERRSTTRAAMDEERVSGMVLLGFLGLADHVRPTAAAAIEALQRAGVDVVMITGDHPSTATAIAEELAMLDGRRVVTGAELDAVGDDALGAWVRDVSVFARVTPAHKVRIVRALQSSGRVVAMTGDGANDAAAIRLAHTGIALGRRGSPSARDAADVVVTDDRIETIIDAIVEGRAMWASVRDALAILLGGNLGEIGFTVGAAALSGSSPLAARQLLLVNLLTDMLPATAIALRPPTHRSPEALLHEGPEASLGSSLVRQIALRAVTTAGGAGGAWLLGRMTGTRRRASTIALAALVGTQLAQTAVAGGTSPVVLLSTVASGAAMFAIIQTPVVSQFFGCTPLGPVGWGIAGGASAAATGASVAVPWLARRMLGTGTTA
ncbi:MAG TPA: cation-translocating P-type ATPase [Acidimicrobiales bacterium]|nr:cation-translocating P-type ATPase [Acidimicrobiales bacterium]